MGVDPEHVINSNSTGKFYFHLKNSTISIYNKTTLCKYKATLRHPKMHIFYKN